MTARPKAREQTPSGVVLLLRLALALVSLAVLGIFGWMVAHRLPYPYDLEWMESGMLCHALRLLNGQPIYAPPSVDFVPHLYTPLWSMVVAGLGKLLGDVSYALGRGVSVVALIGALSVGGYTAFREGGSRLTALAAMMIPLVTFPQTGGFLDLARADSLGLSLTVSGAMLAWYGRESHGRLVLAALLLVAAFFAKQTAAPMIVFVALAMLATRERKVLTFALCGVLSFSLLVYWQNRASQGWFWTYIYQLHQSHPFSNKRAFVEAPRVLLGLLWPGLLLLLWAGLAQLGKRLGEKSSLGLWYLAWLALGGILASCVGFGTQWAHTNAYIPGVFFSSIAIGAAAGRLLTRPAGPRLTGPSQQHRRARLLRETLVLGLLLVALVPWLLRLHPRDHMPTQADRQAGDSVIAVLRSAPGEVLVPFHPFYAHLAGKQTYLHRMGVWDVRGTVAGPVRGLIAALATQKFSRIVFNEKVEYTWQDWPDVLLHYRVTSYIRGPRMFEGAQTAPALVLEPVARMPADPQSPVPTQP